VAGVPPDYFNADGQLWGNPLYDWDAMQRHGFVPYAKEWWHFTLANEPFPDTYFDFPVR